MNEKVLKTCRDCGGEFLGDPRALYCKDCRTRRIVAGKQGKEPPTIKSGWRHMFRDGTGTVIRGGANVMDALDDLCAYEEACEAAGIHGPEELRKALELQKPGTASSGPAGHLPRKGKASERNADGEIVYSCRFCGSCGHFQKDSENKHGAAGICTKHPRKVRAGGGKRGKLIEVPGEFRHVAGAREACRNWTERRDGAND